MPRILQLQTFNNQLWARLEGIPDGLPSPVTLYTEEELRKFKAEARRDVIQQLMEAVEKIV